MLLEKKSVGNMVSTGKLLIAKCNLYIKEIEREIGCWK